MKKKKKKELKIKHFCREICLDEEKKGTNKQRRNK